MSTVKTLLVNKPSGRAFAVSSSADLLSGTTGLLQKPLRIFPMAYLVLPLIFKHCRTQELRNV
jgi:hypothetical protein